MKTFLVLLSLLAVTAAYAQFNGCPPGFCSGIRGFGGGGGGFSPNNNGGGGGGCANDAPDGSVDLSKCSNAFYVAVNI